MESETSPVVRARIAGALYLVIIVAGFFLYGSVRSSIIAPGDAATTGSNILAHDPLYRSGFVAGMILLPCNVVLALMFYELFRVVKQSLSLLVAFFILVATAIETTSLIFYYAPLILLHGGHYSTAFTAGQLQSLAYDSLELQAIGFNAAAVFFALYDLVIAYLIVRATFLPSILGLLMGIAGACYLIDSFANFVSPVFAAHLIPYVLVPSGIGELSLCLWLLILGVNRPKWEMEFAAGERTLV